MDEKDRKRSRKAKLVPRDCLDSDDENIAVMQEEIEAALVHIKNKNILKKLSQPSEPNPLQFSIKVEVEEFSEQRDAENNLSNIRIDSVKSLSQLDSVKSLSQLDSVKSHSQIDTVKSLSQLDSVKSHSQINSVKSLSQLDSVKSLSQPTAPSAPSPSKESDIPYIRISDETLRMEFENLSRKTTSEADKRIEIIMRNYLGRKKVTFSRNYVDENLQNVLFRRKWKNWRSPFATIREWPLFYKCDDCKRAWWHLHDFREHLLERHTTKMLIQLQTVCHECHVRAYSAFGPEVKEGRHHIESNCWRCGRDAASHWGPKSEYKCIGCKEKFYTCTLLFDHECVCPLNYENALKVHGCTQCPARLRTEKELVEHMVLRHSVRSDLPTEWVHKVCSDCKHAYLQQSMHDCIYKPMVSSCKDCFQKFNSQSLLVVHTTLTKKHYPCKVCGTVLVKQCMELQHLVEHTSNYTTVYKCIHCVDSIYFPDLNAINKHKLSIHRGRSESKSLINFYEMLVIPIRLAVTQPGFDLANRQRELEILKRTTEKSFDNAFNGLLGFLGQPSGRSAKRNTCAEKLRKKVQNEIKSRSIKNVDKPPKKPKLDIKLSEHPHEIVVIDITHTDSSHEDEEVDVEIVENPQKNVVFDITAPDIGDEKGNEDMKTPSLEQKKVIVDVKRPEGFQENFNAFVNATAPTNHVITSEICRENIIDDINVPIHTISRDQSNDHTYIKIHTIKNNNDDFRMPKNLQQRGKPIENVSSDNINDISPTGINQFNPNLVIKEEKIDHNDTTESTQQELEKVGEIKIISVKIKEEPLDIQEEAIATSANSNIDTSNISVNKTLITQTVNNQLRPQSDNDQMATNIHKLKTHTNSKLKCRINKMGTKINCKKLRTKINNKLRTFRINCSKLGTNYDGNGVLKTDSDKLKAKVDTLRNHTENDNAKLKAHTDTLKNDVENDNVKLESNNDKLRTNTDELRNTENDKLEDNIINTSIDQLGIQIKQEVDTQEFYDSFVVEEEVINCKIKEENLDELMEHDMIILDPNNRVNMNYEMDSSANTMMTSDDGNTQTSEPEVIVCQKYGKKLYKCTKCDFKGLHQPYKRHLQEAGHFATNPRHACLHKGTKSTENGARYKCTKCDVLYQSFYKYALHFTKVHDYQPRSCPQCFAVFPNMQAVQSHIHTHVRECFVNVYIIKTKKDDDNEQRSHQCKTCAQKFNPCEFFTHWESHLQILDAREKSKPSKGFAPSMEHKHDLKKMLLLLQGIHPPSRSKDDPYTKLRYCLKCKRKFDRKNECKRHYIEHLLMDAYQERHKYGYLRCQICSEDFITSDRYKRHMRDHGSLPIYKCEVCDKTFSDSSNFTKHKKVHNIYVVICDICNKKFTAKPFLIKHLEVSVVFRYKRHMREHGSLPIYKCEVCDKTFSDSSNFTKHKKVHNIYVVICDICNKKFTAKPFLIKHLEVSVVFRYKRHMREHGSLPIYKCEVCDKTFSDSSNFTKHKKVHNIYVVICDICNKKFTAKPFLIKHLEVSVVFRYKRHMREHGSLPIYKCEVCDKTFSDSSNFTKHKKVHNIYVVICDICNKKFTAKPFLIKHLEVSVVFRYKRHMREHGSLPIYKCEVCDKTFSDSSNFTKHKKVHNIYVVICDICNKKFTAKPFLIKHLEVSVVFRYKRHMRKHGSLPIYKCEVCDKTFSDSSNFTKHKKVHNIYVVICDICNKKFTAKPFLIKHLEVSVVFRYKRHMREHGSLPIYKCEVCDKTFSDSSNFTKHKKVHNIYVVICDICNKKFTAKPFLIKHLEVSVVFRYKRHMRKHGSLPIYKCEVCDKTFSDSSNFTKHKKVHNIYVVICDTCNKKFTAKPFLIKHNIVTHEQFKPLVCQECDKVFYSESAYRKHISRSRARFKCPSCHVFFTTLKEKWDHMWEVHKERKFQADCPMCEQSFRKHQDVRNHIRTYHRDRNYKYVPDRTPLARKEKLKAEAAELVVVRTADKLDSTQV